MNWNQKSNPDTKNEDNMRPMCRSVLAMIGLKMPGTIHTTITTLKNTTAKTGEIRKAPASRIG